MFNVFFFCLNLMSDLFAFLDTCIIFEGLSVLDFCIAMIVLFVIIDNFIIKPAKGSSGHFKVSRKSSKGGK